MKILIILLICLKLCRGYEELCQGHYLKKVYTKCLTLNGGNRDVVDDFFNLRRSSNENGKCFRACILHECQFLSSHGQFSFDAPSRLGILLHSGLESQMWAIEKTAANCIGQMDYSNSVCDIAEDFTNCMVRQSTVHLRNNDIINLSRG